MLVQVFGRGVGSGAGPVRYCTARAVKKIDPETGKPTGEIVYREPPPEVLRGNPEITRLLIDSVQNRWKYTSGVIAFERNDAPSDDEIRAVIDDFERTMFAGLEPDQYNTLWVKHTHCGNVELHFVIPRIELRTGKALNIAPPGYQKMFDVWRDSWNYSKGWARPDDPARARVVRRDDHVIKTDAARIRDGLSTAKDPKSAITEWLIDRVKSGLVKNRDDIVSSLSEIGEITRHGDDYVSVKPPGFKRALRLKGVIYERSFDSERFIRDFEEKAGEGFRGNRGVDESRAERARQQLEILTKKRAEFNAERYCQRPTKQQLVVDKGGSSEHASDFGDTRTGREEFEAASDADISRVDDVFSSLDRHLRRELGSDSIPIERNRAAASREGLASAADSAAPESEKGFRAGFERWKSLIEALRVHYDRVREAFKRGISSIISSVRAGYESAGRSELAIAAASSSIVAASREVVAASAAVDANITRDCRKLKMNRDDELRRFKTEINLVEFAESQGYEIDRRESSRASVVMRRGDDKIVVATDKNDGHGIYFSVRDDSDNGTIIDFIQRRRGLNLGEIRKELRPWLSGAVAHVRRPAHQRPDKPEPSAPDRQHILAAFMRMQQSSRNTYLRDERMIDENVLTDARFASMIRTDSRNNAVFPHYDENGLCGYELKNRGFTGFSRGGQKGIWHTTNIENARRIVIVESAIDALSHAQLTRDDDAAYVSTGGAMSDKQRQLLRDVMRDADARGAEIVIAVDSDEAGDLLAAEIVSLAPPNARVRRDVPNSKDWNDVLREHEQVSSRQTKSYSLSM